MLRRRAQVAVSVLGLRPPVPHVGSWGNAPATCLRPGAAGPLLLVPTHNAVLQLYDVGRERHVALLQVRARLGEGAGGGRGMLLP